VESLPEAEIARAAREARAGVLQGIALCGQIADVLRLMDAVLKRNRINAAVFITWGSCWDNPSR
jgi:hypothetical protein